MTHDFDPLSQFCRSCGMPLRELAEAPELQAECSGALDGTWERRAAEDEPRRQAAREEIDRAVARADEITGLLDGLTWGQLRQAFGWPTGWP